MSRDDGGAGPGAGDELGREEVGDLEALTFEQLLERLETLTARLADGDIGIEQAADLYERAQRLHATATARLEAVTRRIEAIPPTSGG